MTKIWKELILIVIGGFLYILLELLWRGWSHISMFILGGLCFWLLGTIGRSLPLTKRALLGGAVITALEFVTGLIVNCWLKLGVWDYSEAPWNLMGQICLPYSLLWILLSGAAIPVCDGLHSLLFRSTTKDYREAESDPIPRRGKAE